MSESHESEKQELSKSSKCGIIHCGVCECEVGYFPLDNLPHKDFELYCLNCKNQLEENGELDSTGV